MQVQPKDSAQPMLGYLSLHQNSIGAGGCGGCGGYESAARSPPLLPPPLLSLPPPPPPPPQLKWTPNRLMNGATIEDKSASWQQALVVDLDSIVFLHCHQVSKVRLTVIGSSQ